MKYKFIITKNNIDFFFDIFEKEGYTYGKAYDNEYHKKEMLEIMQDSTSVKFLEIDTESKTYWTYTKWIKGDEFIEFSNKIQE